MIDVGAMNTKCYSEREVLVWMPLQSSECKDRREAAPCYIPW